jgi:hypothetical protein
MGLRPPPYFGGYDLWFFDVFGGSADLWQFRGERGRLDRRVWRPAQHILPLRTGEGNGAPSRRLGKITGRKSVRKRGARRTTRRPGRSRSPGFVALGVDPLKIIEQLHLYSPKKSEEPRGLSNIHNVSHLPISPPKNEPLWQKNGGRRQNIYHFFSCFFVFWGFLSS